MNGLSKPPRGGRIFGTVMEVLPSASIGPSNPNNPVNGAVVSLKGAMLERQTVTTDGRFEFTELANGTYTVSVDVPKGLVRAQSARILHRFSGTDPLRSAVHARGEPNSVTVLINPV